MRFLKEYYSISNLDIIKDILDDADLDYSEIEYGTKKDNVVIYINCSSSDNKEFIYKFNYFSHNIQYQYLVNQWGPQPRSGFYRDKNTKIEMKKIKSDPILSRIEKLTGLSIQSFIVSYEVIWIELR